MPVTFVLWQLGVCARYHRGDLGRVRLRGWCELAVWMCLVWVAWLNWVMP